MFFSCIVMIEAFEDLSKALESSPSPLLNLTVEASEKGGLASVVHEIGTIDFSDISPKYQVLEENGQKILDISGECADPKDIYLQCKADNEAGWVCKEPVRLRVSCHHRFEWECPGCSKRWRRKTFKKNYRQIMSMRSPKFLTLTLRYKKYEMSTLTRLKLIWEYRKELFRTLREEGKWWNQYRIAQASGDEKRLNELRQEPVETRGGYWIDGWFASIEIPNHLHGAIDMEYIPQETIAYLWEMITGDSFEVWIEGVDPEKDPKKVSSYITSYISKASGSEILTKLDEDFDQHDLRRRDAVRSQISDMLKGFHMVNSWKLPPKQWFHGIICPHCGFNSRWTRMNPAMYLHWLEDYKSKPPPGDPYWIEDKPETIFWSVNSNEFSLG